MKHILMVFEIISSLKVNLSKSSVMGILVEEPCLCGLEDIIGCKIEA